MKALKDFFWEVKILVHCPNESFEEFAWCAIPRNDTLINSGVLFVHEEFSSCHHYKTKRSAERGWINFAKKNEFRKWEFS